MGKAKGGLPRNLADLFEDVRIFECVGQWQEEIIRFLGTEPEQAPTLRVIFNQVETELGARTAVVEPYVSTDWSDEYQAWYSRAFSDLPRLTYRIHFVAGIGDDSRPIERGDLAQLGSIAERNPSAYLGYSVVRPLLPVTVSETILANPYRAQDDRYVPCVARFRSHILGHELAVHAMPYIQQEEVVGVCAEANLWMQARYLHTIGETSRYRPSEMHDLATVNSPASPTRLGLTSEQVFTALNSANRHADLLTPFDANDALSAIHSYVSSGIPVTVGVGEQVEEHAVTIVGAAYSKNDNGIGDSDSIAKFVDAFVVHDDNTGPYQILQITPHEIEHTEAGSFERIGLGDKNVFWCAAALPPRVQLKDFDVRAVVRELLGNSLVEFGGLLGEVPDYRSQAEVEGLLTRTYLKRSDAFKIDLLPKPNPSGGAAFVPRDSVAVALYWRALLPRYVWVAELYEESGWKGNPAGSKIVGELLLDPTAHHSNVNSCLLAAHFRGRMLMRENRSIWPRGEALLTDPRAWNYGHRLSRKQYSPFVRRHS